MKIPSYDVWVMARLLADLPVDGRVEAVSAAFRPLARAMAARDRPERKRIFASTVSNRPDTAAWLCAIAAADPKGPAPEPYTGSAADGLPIRLTRAADVRVRSVEWLWDGRVPLGMLSLWAGPPKVGKSYVSLSLAAGVSRGAAPPHGSVPDGPASVILMSAEDDPSRTIIPRLKAAEADLSRVHILESVVLEGGREALPSLRADMAHVAAAADRLGDCRLIVIDPVSAYLGGVDDHRNAEVRGILSPLKGMAERLNAAVVLLSHLSKGSSANAQQRVIGSIAYVGACRANFLFVKDREDPTGRRVLMLDNGGNLARPAPTLSYSIDDRGEGPRVEWLDAPLPITAEEALAADQAACQVGVAAPERREAEGWLREILGSAPSRRRKSRPPPARPGSRSAPRSEPTRASEPNRSGRDSARDRRAPGARRCTQ
jgi:putative DNA primase/helicase